MTPTRVLALKNVEVPGRLLLYLYGLKTHAKLYAQWEAYLIQKHMHLY